MIANNKKPSTVDFFDVSLHLRTTCHKVNSKDFGEDFKVFHSNIAQLQTTSFRIIENYKN